VCGENMETTATICIYNMPVSISFVFEGQFTQPSAVVVGAVAIERYVSVLDNGKLDRGQCGIVVPVEKN
jgi:hypothetical protein